LIYTNPYISIKNKKVTLHNINHFAIAKFVNYTIEVDN